MGIKKRQLGISTKTSIISGIIVLIFLSVSSLISIKLQSDFSKVRLAEIIKSSKLVNNMGYQLPIFQYLGFCQNQFPIVPLLFW